MAARKRASIKPAQLKAAFKQDLAAAWTRARTSHPDHTPYAFVLYGVEGGTPELTPHVLTEESLTARAQHYLNLQDGSYDTLPEARKALRYSVADSPHFSELEDSLATVKALMAPFEDKIDETAGYELLAKAAMAALKELDKQRAFGTGKQREKLLLLIITEDTDVDWFLPSAKRLNSATAFRRLEKETRVEGTYRNSECLAVSDDGRSLYSVGSRELNRKTEETISEVVAYNISARRLKRRWSFSFPSFGDSGRAIACTHDHSTLFVLRQKYDGRPEALVMRFNPKKNKPLQTARLDGESQSLAVSHDNSRVAVTVDKTVHILDDKLATIQSVRLETMVRGVHFLSTGDLLIATGTGLFQMDGVFNVTRTSHTHGCHDLAVDDAEKFLLIGRRAPSPRAACGIDILSLPSLELVRTILIPNHQAIYPGISPDGRLLAFEAHEIGTYRKFVAVFETATGREIARRKSDFINDLKFLPDNRTIAIAQGGISNSEPIPLWTVPEP